MTTERDALARAAFCELGVQHRSVVEWSAGKA
jgi:hypothetical protein